MLYSCYRTCVAAVKHSSSHGRGDRNFPQTTQVDITLEEYFIDNTKSGIAAHCKQEWQTKVKMQKKVADKSVDKGEKSGLAAHHAYK